MLLLQGALEALEGLDWFIRVSVVMRTLMLENGSTEQFLSVNADANARCEHILNPLSCFLTN